MNGLEHGGLLNNSMKKIALISSFCDTNHKIEVLKKNLIKLNEIGIDSLILTPIFLGEDILNLSTYCFYTKENPILKWPERANTFWYSNVNELGEYVEMHRDIDDYGWAAVYQMKKLSEIALTFEYDIFYHMIYDLEISENVINDINNNVTNKTYHRINPKNSNTFWEITLHFLIMDRNNTLNFRNKLNKKDYLNLNGFAEEYVKHVLEDFNLEKSDFDVKDIVRHIDADDNNIFNYSKTNEYKIFFSKWDEDTKNISNDLWVVIYDFNKKNEVKLILNENTLINVNHLTPLKFNISEIIKLEVRTLHTTIDYTDTIDLINRNVIKYTNRK
jgi:hypothetical protein